MFFASCRIAAALIALIGWLFCLILTFYHLAAFYAWR